jgi:XTP/dITP diphosphohydrolase
VQLLFATTNAGKLAELEQLVGGLLVVVSPAAYANLPEVEEDQPTFEGNAEKKARAFAQATGLPALADDSGLCVDALDGRPGVHSARYAADSPSRIARLLRELEGVPEEKRTAHFRCALCLALPSGAVKLETGECHGRITVAPRGEKGFGYDPVFFVPELGKTLAEVGARDKSSVSHRGQAFRKMRVHLVELAQGRLT